MADDEVKWEATSSGQTTLFFFCVCVFLKWAFLQDPSPQSSLPPNQKLYLCHFLSLCWIPANLRMERRMRRHSHPRMEPVCQMSTLAKMSSLWQYHIHNKAFIYTFSFFFHLDIYIPFVFIFTPVSPQNDSALEKEKKHSCISGVVTHDNTQLARAKRGRQMQSGSPHKRTAPRHVSGGAPWKPVFASPLRILFTSNFLLIFWVFDWPAVTTQCSTKEREIERDRENQPAHIGARDPPPAPQSEPFQTQRGRGNTPPPSPKEKQKLCRSLTGVGTGTGRGEGQGASRGRPCRDRRTEMGRAQQRTNMQLRLPLWRPGWEL